MMVGGKVLLLPDPSSYLPYLLILAGRSAKSGKEGVFPSNFVNKVLIALKNLSHLKHIQ